MLTFKEFRNTNLLRVKRWHKIFTGPGADWTGSDWSNAACGEMGEAANVVKKLRRLETDIKHTAGDTRDELRIKLEKEIGDTVVYLDLLASYYDLTLEDCVRHAFNQISEREGFPERLSYGDFS